MGVDIPDARVAELGRKKVDIKNIGMEGDGHQRESQRQRPKKQQTGLPAQRAAPFLPGFETK